MTKNYFASLGAVALFSATSFAQLNIDSVSGTLTGLNSFTGVNGPLAAGDHFQFGSLDTSTSSASVRFSGSASQNTFLDSPYDTRGIVRFQSRGSNRMSSDNEGNLSNAVDGEVRKFTTWNNQFMSSFSSPKTYTFGAEGLGGGDGSKVDINFYNMAYPNLTASTTSQTLLGLDNSAYDEDPNPFKIKINRLTHPSITDTKANIAGGSAFRKLYFDGDGDVASPFYDGFFSSAGVELQVGSDWQELGFGFGKELGQWAPGEDNNVAVNFGAHNSDLSLDFSKFENGIYNARVRTGLWQRLGGDTVANVTSQSFYPGTSSSEFDGSLNQQYTIEVVPEPASMLALAVGAVALVRRRAKK